MIVRPLTVRNATVKQTAATPTQASRNQPGSDVSKILVMVNTATTPNASWAVVIPNSQPRDSRGPNRTRGTLTVAPSQLPPHDGSLPPGGNALGGAGMSVASGSTCPGMTSGGGL